MYYIYIANKSIHDQKNYNVLQSSNWNKLPYNSSQPKDEQRGTQER